MFRKRVLKRDDAGCFVEYVSSDRSKILLEEGDEWLEEEKRIESWIRITATMPKGRRQYFVTARYDSPERNEPPEIYEMFFLGSYIPIAYEKYLTRPTQDRHHQSNIEFLITGLSSNEFVLSEPLPNGERLYLPASFDAEILKQRLEAETKVAKEKI